ncbi:Major facilitator superfamily transporter protein [Pleurostoma richardsiae]|uniref:Major facilitator superfamily transporter protein n=1 Tax=Pleurostoma richardsiae TaxID=41990 RepID=A0AA38RHB9_9PEZI|nr:Major facilitator superfamily transporter protein [Pleurostoma richardsiae]
MDVSDAPRLRTVEENEPQLELRADENNARAWLSVVGAFLFLFPSYGFMQSIGTIQSYVELHQLSAYTTRDIGWITGVYIFLATVLGIQIGPLFDLYGPRVLGPAGAAIYIPTFFLLAECSKYWHFMLCLGVLGGIGAAIVSTVAVAAIGKWFVRRRGLAMGLSLCGSSVGGVVIPLMLRQLFPRVGWAWSMRALAFIVTVVLVIGSFCLQPSPQHGQGRRASGQRVSLGGATLNFAALTSKAFISVAVGIFVLEFAIFGVFGLLPSYAVAAHFPAEMGYTLVAIANACSCLGRLLPGFAGDYLGHFNVLLFMILITVAFTASILVPFGSTSIAALYAFSALWGFGSGSFISLTPVCMGKTCETANYGRYYGTMYFFVSFSLLMALPLGGQMLETLGTRALAGLYLGVVFLGAICFLAARQFLLGQTHSVKAKI